MEINPDQKVTLLKIEGEYILYAILTSIKKLRIPEYQRPFSWDKTMFSTFLDDIFIHRNDTETYFIGTNYFGHVNDKQSSTRDIIDGQQRITAFLLISKFLSIFFKNNEAKQLFKKIQITYSSLDQPIWEKILAWDTSDIKQIKHDIKSISDDICTSNRKKIWCDALTKIYGFFFGDKTAKKKTNKDIQSFSKYLYKKVEVIPLATDQPKGDDKFFYTINGKGAKLSDVDLIKSILFDMFNKNNPKISASDGSRIKFKDFWGQLIANTNDGICTYINFWLKNVNKSIKISGKIKDFLKYVSKKKTSASKAAMLKEIWDRSDGYEKLEKKNFNSTKINFYAYLFDIFKFVHAKNFLFTFSRALNSNDNKIKAGKVVELLFYYHLTLKLSNASSGYKIDVSKVENLMIKLYKETDLASQINLIREEIKNNNFKDNFIEELSYYPNSKAISFFVCLLQKYSEKNIPELDINSFIANLKSKNKDQLDHIFPKDVTCKSKDMIENENGKKSCALPYYFKTKLVSGKEKPTEVFCINAPFDSADEFGKLTTPQEMQEKLNNIQNLALLPPLQNKSKLNNFEYALGQKGSMTVKEYFSKRISLLKNAWSKYSTTVLK